MARSKYCKKCAHEKKLHTYGIRCTFQRVDTESMTITYCQCGSAWEVWGLSSITYPLLVSGFDKPFLPNGVFGSIFKEYNDNDSIR